MGNCSIQIDDLKKSYGNVPVLHGVSFQVRTGSLVGFLGPNGAGKSTTIRILLGLLKKTSGQVSILGKEVNDRFVTERNRIGYLPGEVNLYPGMSGRATIKHFARVRKVDCYAYAFELAEKLDLNLDRAVRRCSSGMRQKLGLILAMMHRPDLLILDEPTSTLDPLVRQVVFDELRQVVNEGRTVLFSSHSLREVEELCDEVVILRDGRVVEQNSIELLKQRAVRTVTLEFDEKPDVFPNDLSVQNVTANTVVGVWKGDPQSLVQFLAGCELKQLVVERPGLEDLFLTYYSDAKELQSSSLTGSEER